MTGLRDKFKTYALVGALATFSEMANYVSAEDDMGKNYFNRLSTGAVSAVAPANAPSAPIATVNAGQAIKAKKKSPRKAKKAPAPKAPAPAEVKITTPTVNVPLSTPTPNIALTSSTVLTGLSSNGWYIGGGPNTAGKGEEVIVGIKGKNLGGELGIGYRYFKSSLETNRPGTPFSGRTKIQNNTQDITGRLSVTVPVYRSEKITYNYSAPTSTSPPTNPSTPVSSAPYIAAGSSVPITVYYSTANPKLESTSHSGLELRLAAGPAVLWRTGKSHSEEAIYLNGAQFGLKERDVVNELNKPHAGFSAGISLLYNKFLGLFVNHSVYDKAKPITTIGAYWNFGGDNSNVAPNYDVSSSSATPAANKAKVGRQ